MRLSQLIAAICAALFGVGVGGTSLANAQSDPFAQSSGSWGQAFADQWALSALNLPPLAERAALAPVTVAVVDSGLDWFHQDSPGERLWINAAEIPDNGVDDDGNGYVDDVHGWNVIAQSGYVWDYLGHGTFVAGIIGARSNNGAGVEAVAPHVRIMTIKAANDFGRSNFTLIADGIRYAADNGAQVINVSIGGQGATPALRDAVSYAAEKDAVVVLAAGNTAAAIAPDFGPGGHPDAITVGALGVNGARYASSSWGWPVDVLAPGEDILAPRALDSDFLVELAHSLGEPWPAQQNVLTGDPQYYRATGTSFAAPMVAGVAALIRGRYPELNAAQVRRMIVHSARDIGGEGPDPVTGYGAVDAAAALAADPDFFIATRISAIGVGAGPSGPALDVRGIADADRFARARLDMGPGEAPDSWRTVATVERTAQDAVIAAIPAADLAGSPVWTLRLVVEHESGAQRATLFKATLG